VNRERTFAFVDLAGFTALTEAHGDAVAVATLARFRALVDAALGPEDVVVKTIGDAVMLACATPLDAARALVRLFGAVEADDGLPLLRGGVHSGPALEEDGDYFGAAVNLAARVGAFARGGQLLSTAPVAFAATEIGAVVTHVGPIALRSIAKPIDLYDISIAGLDATAIDPVCAMKVPMSGPAVVTLHHHDTEVWFCGLPCAARYAAAPERFEPSSLMAS
jgi:adenylate cyclase